MTEFSELKQQVHLIKDLILADMTYGTYDYAKEAQDFSKHLLATKYWFARISFANKKLYVLTLLNDVNSVWTLSLLLKSLWNCRPKDAVLSVCESNVWSSYDQAPLDHNRTAQPAKTLGMVMTNDRKWFHSLEPESQAIVLSELLTVAGGPVMWEVLRRAQVLYHRYRDSQLQNLLECIVIQDHTDKEKKELHQISPTTKLKSQTTVNNPTDPDATRPPGHAHKELESAITAWNAKIKSIRDSQKLEEIEMKFNDGTERTIWKVNRPKPEGIETVDFIQLLPAMVGKRILSCLPRAQLGDYARVNKYWAFLVDEFRAELATRQKLRSDLDKLRDLMLKHDTSMEVVVQAAYAGPSSLGVSTMTSPKPYYRLPSARQSEKSAGVVSFRHFLDEKKNAVKKQRPIRNLVDVSERLERRGATDEHLWQWCENVLKQTKKTRKEDLHEGVLRFKDIHFPCPMMKRNVEIPLGHPLCRDPSVETSSKPKRKDLFSASVNVPKDQEFKRYHLWSRDFSSLYKVFKVASYQSPV